MNGWLRNDQQLPPDTQMQLALNSQGVPFGPHLHPLPQEQDSNFQFQRKTIKHLKIEKFIQTYFGSTV